MSLSEADKFKSNAEDLLSFLECTVEELQKKGVKLPFEPIILSLGQTLLKGKPSQELIESFIVVSHKHWDKAQEYSDDVVLTTIKDLYPSISDNVYKFIENLLVGDKELISKEDKETLYTYTRSFITLSVKHIHHMRKPGNKPDGTRGYTVNYFPAIKVKHYVDLFKITI